MSIKEQNKQEIGLIRSIAAHPYLWTFVICIFLDPFYLGAEGNVPPNALFLETLMVLAGGFSLLYYLYKSQRINLLSTGLFAAAFVLCDVVFLKWYSSLYTKGIVLLFLGFIFMIGILRSINRFGLRKMKNNSRS